MIAILFNPLAVVTDVTEIRKALTVEYEGVCEDGDAVRFGTSEILFLGEKITPDMDFIKKVLSDINSLPNSRLKAKAIRDFNKFCERF